ncbi:MAG: DUF2167 domain-containing protein [Bacteroidetes bacterium]|nr:DUF2167 domain-containing protein [Bacteroidota bacterium]
MKKITYTLLIAFFSLASFAQEIKEDSLALLMQATQNYYDSINKSFTYQTGEILLDGGMAKIKTPKGLKFLDAKQSKTVLVDLWGNPNADGIIGMLFPEKYTPLDSNSWAFTISFDEMGFVEDDDAEDMDYAELLETMKKETLENSAEREKNGYERIELIGWASAPFYDKERKVLHWAKELKFGESTINTLNYDVRALGRKGVLSMNAVGSIHSLPEVKPVINYLLSSVEFTEGNRYKDFNPEIDQVAAWTVGGLVAGKVLAKVGFFALLLKYSKLIFIGIAAAAAGIWKWIKNRGEKKEENDKNPPTDITNTPS